MRIIKRLTREGKDSGSTHRQKIEESKENEISSEFKVMIKKFIEDNSEYEKLEEKFMELYKKYRKEEMTKKEKVEFKNNIEKLKKITPLNLDLYAEISGFKAYCKKHSDSTKINNIQSNFIEKLSRKQKTHNDLIENIKSMAREKKIKLKMFNQQLNDLNSFSTKYKKVTFITAAKILQNLMGEGKLPVFIKNSYQIVLGRNYITRGEVGFDHFHSYAEIIYEYRCLFDMGTQTDIYWTYRKIDPE